MSKSPQSNRTRYSKLYRSGRLDRNLLQTAVAVAVAVAVNVFPGFLALYLSQTAAGFLGFLLLYLPQLIVEHRRLYMSC